ncbi:hypothetical protein SAMN05216436_11876 [bacterium A37T11]|nr:hypothetical protein SAMN05216436_11876 [bacterium A37T11]
MNFLSHFYFERFNPQPALVTGSVLPDLVKNADKTINLHPQKHEELFHENYLEQQLFLGWKRHIETDRLFHNSDFFYRWTHELKIAIDPILTGTNIRGSFLSHISLELLLDHLLLEDNLVHEDDFYNLLNITDRSAIVLFLNHCGLINTQFFFKFYEKFVREKYSRQYRNVKQLSSALGNICNRIWPEKLSEWQHTQLTNVLFDYVQLLRKEYIQIFDHITRQLPLT